MTVGFAACVANAVASSKIYDASASMGLFSSAAALNAIVIVCGAVGLFAYQRPCDVHWHLALAFDLMCIAFSVISFLVSSFPPRIRIYPCFRGEDVKNTSCETLLAWCKKFDCCSILSFQLSVG